MRRPKIFGAAIVAMATATMFSSCIETDEPAGIEKLRTAKAEYITAEADLKEFEAKFKEIEFKIADSTLQKEIEVALINQEKAICEAKEALAKAQLNYETYLKKLEMIEVQFLDTESSFYSDYKKAYENMIDARGKYLGYFDSYGSFYKGTTQVLMEQKVALEKYEAISATAKLVTTAQELYDAKNEAWENETDSDKKNELYEEKNEAYNALKEAKDFQLELQTEAEDELEDDSIYDYYYNTLSETEMEELIEKKREKVAIAEQENEDAKFRYEEAQTTFNNIKAIITAE